ncbi:efflux RND transporter permease subunit [Sphingosinicella rhizophila]|uniref:Efflux pump membrane transporter n=1 Tax=Sphingosinicella rhizophila TaxID=3050082 RepID=A0ABU3Q6D7_9SPHN|nr:multidrug efflux RND transporter permease subunit [Sphingosinicella sp. GR2756]MDT9598887.1 multidrug efflux RND transporter permease subunit [Sphingosinicella sp. GR2756]
MNISAFFIERPIFAAVIGIFITLIGVFSYPQLPLSQYPEIAPPTVQVNAFFPGGSAESMAETVSLPLEQAINGVEDMLYMSSSSTSSGQTVVTVTFEPGTDLDEAQVLVQNRVNTALPRLPEQVRQIGVTVNKAAVGFLMIAALTAEDPQVDIDYVGNYANSVVRDRLLRLEGVGDVLVFGGGNYSMRIWIDPDRAAARNLTAGEIVTALRTQNVQVAGGAVGQPPYAGGNPAFEQPIEVKGRLSDPAEFADVVIKTGADGSITRIRDIGRVELGSQEYGVRAQFGGKPGVALAMIQQPGSNALDSANRVLADLEDAAREFPPGIGWTIPYNPTEYVQASVDAVQETLIEAIVLVVIVVIAFLQTWRASIIPIVAIPIALIGTFAVQLALGFSINSLSLFGLVLAVGIVVDDAIVVVEAVEKHIREGMAPRAAAHRTMQEVSGALIAIGLVLSAVFIPTAFVSGIPGIFYRQFAITISAAAIISLLVSLTLSPALAALLLKPHDVNAVDAGSRWLRPVRVAGQKFNSSFEWLADRYGRFTAKAVRMVAMLLIVYAGLLALTGWRLLDTQTGFIPEQDQGVLIGIIQLPPGASLDRTTEVVNKAQRIAFETPGIINSGSFAGFEGASFSQASNAGTMFLKLKPFEERRGEEGMTATELAGTLTMKMAQEIEEAQIFFIAPPAVEGLGNGSGFMMMLQQKSGVDYRALEGVTMNMMMSAAQVPEVTQVFSLFNTGSPRIVADVDRDRAQLLGVQPNQVYDALGTYLGSTYVNDFNMLGRTFRVTAQAEPTARDDLADVGRLQVRSVSGEMVPLSSVATLRHDSGPSRVVRYNMLPAVELQGAAAPGVSSGAALAAMEQLAAEKLPPGFTYEWTGLAYQEIAAGNTAPMIFLLAVFFVFLVLAAQYEALTLPLAVILIVPMCILAALVGVNLRGQDNNILTQVGLVVLVALAAKNAILIVEFAKQAEDHGEDRFQAAVTAARQRLRPILMTSFAFIFGVIPLAIAVGPGSEMRQSLGTSVAFGMVGVTLFGLIFTPVFYVLTRGWAERYESWRDRRRAAAAPPLTPEEGKA